MDSFKVAEDSIISKKLFWFTGLLAPKCIALSKLSNYMIVSFYSHNLHGWRVLAIIKLVNVCSCWALPAAVVA